MTRKLQNLIDNEDPGIRFVREWSHTASSRTTLFEPIQPLAEETLMRLQITTRSILGAVAYETGGVAANDGLIRVLGSGADRSLLKLNDPIGGMRTGSSDDFILIADDVMGGLFCPERRPVR